MYKAFLSLRYLRTRYIALASIVSVMLGVATMIVVNSVMKGFTSEMRSRIQGLLSDIVIETNSLDGQENAAWHFDRVRSVAGDKVAGMTATVEVWGLMTFKVGAQYTTRPITLIGIVPAEKDTVGPLKQYLESYHPIHDGTKVVRPALRSPTEPLGWQPTAAAMAWRKEMIERSNLIKQRLQDFDRPIDGADKPGARIRPTGHEELQRGDSGRAPGGAPTHAPGPPSSAAPVKKTPATAPNELDDPLAIRDTTLPSFPEDEAGPKNDDPSEPQPARLYVGAGLIRYPYTDPKTGKTTTMDMVHCGEDVTISTVTAGRPPDRTSFTATVVDIFKCGMSEYDSNLVFCNLEALQHWRKMTDPEHPSDASRRGITSIQIKLKNYADAEEVIDRLKAVFPPGIYTIKTWEQKQGPLLAAVEIETGILNVLLFLIIAVAGFGILAIFFMIVVEKTRDIGVLKALGASSGGVMSIFLSYGLALGIAGSGVGVLLGLLFVRYINEIESAIAALTGRKVFDDKIYYFPQIPTLVEPWTVLWVTFGAIAIAVLASVLPARRAARLRPVEALRYE